MRFRAGSLLRAYRRKALPTSPACSVATSSPPSVDEGVRSQADFYRKLWAHGAAGSDIPLRLLQGIDIREIKVRSMDRLDYFRQKPTY